MNLVAPVKSAPGGLDDDTGVGEGEVLEVDSVLQSKTDVRRLDDDVMETTYGSGHVGTSYTLNRRVEVVECLALNDLRADLAANTECGETTLDDDNAATRVYVSGR